MNHSTQARRKRANFMISMSLLEKLSAIPSGERSNFVNEAVEEKFTSWGRKKAIENLKKSITKETRIHTTKEILKTLHEGRS